jgi:hypothetical protein
MSLTNNREDIVESTYKELRSVGKGKAVANHGLMTSFATNANQIRAPEFPGQAKGNRKYNCK